VKHDIAVNPLSGGSLVTGLIEQSFMSLRNINLQQHQEIVHIL
jgi:hypothetical protein